MPEYNPTPVTISGSLADILQAQRSIQPLISAFNGKYGDGSVKFDPEFAMGGFVYVHYADALSAEAKAELKSDLQEYSAAHGFTLDNLPE